VLRDSAKVQRQDARIVNRIRLGEGLPPAEVLYDSRAAEQAIAQMVTVPYGQRFRVGPAAATFFDAGHILGSAVVLLEGDGRRLGFTGDLGRPGSPIVRDPAVLPAVDLLLTESTYGGREHGSLGQAEARLAEVVTGTVRGGGRVLIPAFALGRTQQIIHSLRSARDAGRLADIPVYVDSPMAIDATAVYRRHPECFDDEMRARLRGRDPFGFKGPRYVRTHRASQALAGSDEPCVVIASSGMVEGGRIRGHLRERIGDPRSVILFVGYQAEHTLGRRLVEGAPEVRIYGEPYQVKIRVERVEAFSAHADHSELLAWARRVPEVGRAFCVHGDEAPAQALAQALSVAGVKATVPTVGQAETV
jgi:metallo-beta-lactamase family protein